VPFLVLQLTHIDGKSTPEKNRLHAGGKFNTTRCSKPEKHATDSLLAFVNCHSRFQHRQRAFLLFEVCATQVRTVLGPTISLVEAMPEWPKDFLPLPCYLDTEHHIRKATITQNPVLLHNLAQSIQISVPCLHAQF